MTMIWVSSYLHVNWERNSEEKSECCLILFWSVVLLSIDVNKSDFLAKITTVIDVKDLFHI